MYHYTPSDFLSGYDPTEIAVVGAGGTGSQVITGLARINHAIMALGHTHGLSVNVVDPDEVSEFNIGRQLFSPVDIGESKARILVERVNHHYGLAWQSLPLYFKDYIEEARTPKIIISCVDSVSARREIRAYGEQQKNERFSKPLYWLDTGNGNATGQVILGTNGPTDQPDNTESCGNLPDILDWFPALEEHDTPDTPSCSMEQALEKQDLFVNQSVAVHALDILWRMFRYGRIKYHGCFVDQENYTVRPMSVENSFNRFYKEEVV